MLKRAVVIGSMWGLTVALGTPALHATVESSVYEELVALNPGTTVSEMQDSVVAHAKASGKDPADVAAEALREAREHASELGVGRVSAERSMTMGSGGGDKVKVLPTAKAKGDIFWWDSATDHVGLYTTTTKVIHAPGRGVKAKIQSRQDVGAPKRTELMLVNTKDK